MSDIDRCACGRPIRPLEPDPLAVTKLAMRMKASAPQGISMPEQSGRARLNGEYTPSQLRELADAIEHCQGAGDAGHTGS